MDTNMRWFALILCLMMPSGGIAEQLQVSSQFLCIAEKATGFMFRDGEWKSTNFETEKMKWIVKSYGKVTVGENGLVNDMNGAVYQFGDDDIADFDCTVSLNSVFRCKQGSLGEFKMVTHRKKYIRTFGGDFEMFVETTTPFIEIGSCSEF